jgi:hypothetical protein
MERVDPNINFQKKGLSGAVSVSQEEISSPAKINELADQCGKVGAIMLDGAGDEAILIQPPDGIQRLIPITDLMCDGISIPC